MARLSLTAAIIVLGFSSNAGYSQARGIVGSWEGKSLCVDKAHYPACKDEHVIYDAVAKGKARDTVTVRADKVVNGVREFMGEFDFSFESDSSWVTHFQNPRVKLRIDLRIRADHMNGSMTDEITGRRIREMTLDRIH